MMLAMLGLMAGNAYQNAYVDGDDSSVEDPDPAYRPFFRIRRGRGRGFFGSLDVAGDIFHKCISYLPYERPRQSRDY